MSSDEIAGSDLWLDELLAPYAAEIRQRNLIVHYECDPLFQWTGTASLVSAFERLFRFVFSTLPDGCEVDLAFVRAIAPVASVGAGTLSVRWQVAGGARRPEQGEVATLRPIAGGAGFHRQSKAARELEGAFREAGWSLRLDAMPGDNELRVRASYH